VAILIVEWYQNGWNRESETSSPHALTGVVDKSTRQPGAFLF
jgi:hypothetical protein